MPPPLSEPVQGPDFAPPAEAQPPLPLAVQKTDDKLSVRTGLSDVASYQGRELARKIEGIKTSLPPGMPVPRAAALPGSALDVWTGIEANGLAASSIASEPDAHLKTSVGADYKFFARSKAGIAIERSEAAEAALRAGRSQDEKISAYITLSAMPGVSLDTRAEWDKAAAAASEPSAAAKTSVSVAPRVGHSFAVGSGASLEPYVTMKHEIDVEDPAAARAPVATNSAGAGITLAKPDAFSLGLSTTLEHLSGGEPASVNSRLQLSVPLR